MPPPGRFGDEHRPRSSGAATQLRGVPHLHQAVVGGPMYAISPPYWDRKVEAEYNVGHQNSPRPKAWQIESLVLISYQHIECIINLNEKWPLINNLNRKNQNESEETEMNRTARCTDGPTKNVWTPGVHGGTQTNKNEHNSYPFWVVPLTSTHRFGNHKTHRPRVSLSQSDAIRKLGHVQW